MTKQRHIGVLMTIFAIITGFIIGAVIWLYLKASNVGVTLIWDKIGTHLPWTVYTITICLVGGLVIGLYRRRFGSHPENMGSAVRYFMQEGVYPYQNLPIVLVAALLPILFGGAIGPESGLVCLLLAFCVWARDHFGLARQSIQELIDDNPQISGAQILRRILGPMFRHPGQVVYEKGKVKWTRSLQVGCGVAAGLGGLFVYVLFNILFGGAFTLPHIEGGAVIGRDRLVMLLMLAIGIGAGYLYLVLRKVASKIFTWMEGKGFIVINAILGGLIVGIVGSRLPIALFSGCADIQTIFDGETVLPTLFSGAINFKAFQYEYFSAAPVVLIVIGVIKLGLTNVCIESGWRGGHFFPLLFSGLSIGYGFAGLLGANEIMSVVVVAGALLGTVLQQPVGALVLSVIFFPLRQLGWMLMATFASGCIPLPKALRMNPDNPGFVRNTRAQIQKRQTSKQEKAEENV